jgi:hypothetical protein
VNRAEAVVAYINRLSDWELVPFGEPYGHVGATLTDAVLQAGITYRTVVEPRVNRLLAQYPNATTTTAFSKVLDDEGATAVLQWNGERKITTLKELIALLLTESVETEDELRVWLESPHNVSRLKEIKGISNKTADYLQMNCGIQGIAIDRHLLAFLSDSGVPCGEYREAREVLDDTARLLGAAPSDLGYSIWKYMSERESRRQIRFCAAQEGGR